MQTIAIVLLALAALTVVWVVFEFGIIGLVIFILIVVGLSYLMYTKGLLKATLSQKQEGVTIDILESGKMPGKPKDLDGAQVFHVNENRFTASQAEDVCKAYGADLASYDQLETAYQKGASWCGYGWSQGGMALFPISDHDYEHRYKHDPKHTCGRPGVNGGFLDPSLKLGVNCYGKKPSISTADIDKYFPAHRPEDPEVNHIKDILNELTVNPWADRTWSEPSVPTTFTEFEPSAKSLSSKAQGFFDKVRGGWYGSGPSPAGVAAKLGTPKTG